MATEENLGVILVQGTLVVAHGRHVLDHDAVVRVLVLLVQDGVSGDHVVHDVALGDLFRAELLLRRQVLAVVVAEMVVACDRGEFDASVDQKVDQCGLHLGLAGLEVIASNERTVLLSKLDSARHKGVLGRAVDEGNLVENASHGEDGGW